MTSARKRVVIIAFTNLEKDVRVMRSIGALSKEYEVVSIGYGERPTGVSNHFQIPREKRYLPISIRGIASLLSRNFNSALKSTQAIKWTTRVLNELTFDVLYLNDVQTIGLLENLRSKATLIDMHEYAPLEMEDDWRFRLLLQRYYFFLCRRYLPRADAIITVSDGLGRRYSEEFDIKVDVIFNARDKYTPVGRSQKSGSIRLVHTGLAARGRHLERMIQAVEKMNNFELDLYLVEAPRQKSTLSRLIKEARKTDNCRVLDPVPSSELPELISQYDAGLVFIAPSNFSLKHSMPNKLFDCIQARVPVITGPSPDIAELVGHRSIGFVTEGFSAKDLQALLKTISHSELDSKSPYLQIAADDLNSDSEARKLVQIIGSIVD